EGENLLKREVLRLMHPGASHGSDGKLWEPLKASKFRARIAVRRRRNTTCFDRSRTTASNEISARSRYCLPPFLAQRRPGRRALEGDRAGATAGRRARERDPGAASGDRGELDQDRRQ